MLLCASTLPWGWTERFFQNFNHRVREQEREREEETEREKSENRNHRDRHRTVDIPAGFILITRNPKVVYFIVITRNS